MERTPHIDWNSPSARYCSTPDDLEECEVPWNTRKRRLPQRTYLSPPSPTYDAEIEDNFSVVIRNKKIKLGPVLALILDKLDAIENKIDHLDGSRDNPISISDEEDYQSEEEGQSDDLSILDDLAEDRYPIESQAYWEKKKNSK